MKKRTRTVIFALVIAALAGFAGFEITLSNSDISEEAAAYAAVGGKKVAASYEAWVSRHEARGGDRQMVVPLSYRKGLSSEYTTAHGKATLDLIDGTVAIEVEGLDSNGDWEAWLVDNRPGPGGSAQPDAFDQVVSLGRLTHEADGAALEADLGSELFERFQVDVVTVARAGYEARDGLLFGSAPLFQRLYTATASPKLLQVSDFNGLPGVSPTADARFSFGVAYAADTVVDPDVLFDALVAEGADLFINEQFNGNGRTCATCHPSAANFTLNAQDIARLPDDDPLFAAEFIPALAFTEAGPKFEVPVLMRSLAQIVENQDGMGDLVNNFNMRGIPHTLALGNALTPGTPVDGTDPNVVQRTGWSGDGAPVDGSLRQFATGAVIQHFPLTLGRVDGVDFRLPTDPELDAMEAFQLSLGRQDELDLSTLSLTDAIASLGQQIFTTVAIGGGPGVGQCNACHANAGATFGLAPGGLNVNFDTNVEDQVSRPTELVLSAAGLDLTPAEPSNLVSPDGGFGLGDPTNFGIGPGSLAVGFGDGTFNTPVVVEAADTAPFFHDNSISTLEGSVAFYNSDAFNTSPIVQAVNIPVDLEATEIQAVASFLRVINALENLRSSIELEEAALHRSRSTAHQLLRQSVEELFDARRVLRGADLHPEAVIEIENAIIENARAIDSIFGFLRDIHILIALQHKENAVNMMKDP